MSFESSNVDQYNIEDKPAKRGRKPRVGRTDRSGQEKVIDFGEFGDDLITLVDLYKLLQDHNADFNAGIKATAEKCGINASAVRKVVVARAGKAFEDKAREAKQLSLAFDAAS